MALRLLLVALLAGVAQAGEYDGKYKTDPRLAQVRAGLPRSLAAARKRIPYKGAVRVELRDLGSDRSGRIARTRRAEQGCVIVLYTEPLVLRTHDPESTLAHELVHCLQNEKWGARGDVVQPHWVREGMAVYLSGQFDERARALAAHAGREPVPTDAVSRLVNGLGGRHGLRDYAEDGAAFLAVEKRHGREKAQAFVEALLAGDRAAAAVMGVLGERFEVFEAASAAYARRRLTPLVDAGRAPMLLLRRLVAERSYELAIRVPPIGGVYAQDEAFLRATAYAESNRAKEALAILRKGMLDLPVRDSTLLDQGLVLELKLLKSLKRMDALAAAAQRARLDLTAYGSYSNALKVIDPE